MRLILRSIRCSFEPQVEIDGVGRVDFLVDEWLIVECDSEAHHGSWAAQKSDRRRDQAAAAQGLATVRPIAEDIMWHRASVRAAVAGLVMLRPRAAAMRRGSRLNSATARL
jgi:very-short-patch-repair endonuclease